MTTIWRVVGVALLLAAVGGLRSGAVELRVSREALERTLKQQLFNGPDGRYYLKGNAQSPCFVYADDPKLHFVQDRFVVSMKTHSRLGKKMGDACLGISLSLAGRGLTGAGWRGRDDRLSRRPRGQSQRP